MEKLDCVFQLAVKYYSDEKKYSLSVSAYQSHGHNLLLCDHLGR